MKALKLKRLGNCAAGLSRPLAEPPIGCERFLRFGTAPSPRLRRLHRRGNKMRDEIGFGMPVVLSRRDIPHVRYERDQSVSHRHCLRVLSQTGTLRAFRFLKAQVPCRDDAWLSGKHVDRAIFRII